MPRCSPTKRVDSEQPLLLQRGQERPDPDPLIPVILIGRIVDEGQIIRLGIGARLSPPHREHDAVKGDQLPRPRGNLPLLRHPRKTPPCPAAEAHEHRFRLIIRGVAGEEVADPHPLTSLAEKPVAGAPSRFLDASRGLLASPYKRLVIDLPCTAPLSHRRRFGRRPITQAVIHRQGNNGMFLGMRPMKQRKAIGPARDRDGRGLIRLKRPG